MPPWPRGPPAGHFKWNPLLHRAMENPYAVSEETLAALSWEGATGLVRRMILEEAGSAGVRLDQLRDDGESRSPHCGVSFAVRGAPRESAGGFIGRGDTLYAVRTGAFSPPRDVRRTLFGRRGGLKAPVRECLAGGGTLALILTGRGGSAAMGPELDGRFAEALRGELTPSACGRVRVWTAGMIASLLARHPNLALLANSTSADGLMPHAAWSRLADMSSAFMAGGGEDEFVRRLRERLLAGGSTLVRVTGAPGSGKTRLVLEATRDERLRGRVVYAEKPRWVLPLLGRARGRRAAGRQGPIVVVDGCTRVEEARIWNQAKNGGPVSLVTIHNEAGDGAADAARLPVPPLAGEQLREIIASYEGAGGCAGEWVEYCGASPRAAHVVGANLEYSPGYMLRPLSTVDVWHRYIAGQSSQPEELADRKAVLEWLSLFRAFEHDDGGARGGELDCIGGLAEGRWGMPRGTFTRTVRELRCMGVLEGGRMLHIAPGLLHVFMWVEWWRACTARNAPGPEQLEGAGGTDGLLRRYLDMFRYVRRFPEASRIVEGLARPGGHLDPDGPLGRRLGADFFGR